MESDEESPGGKESPCLSVGCSTEQLEDIHVDTPILGKIQIWSANHSAIRPRIHKTSMRFSVCCRCEFMQSHLLYQEAIASLIPLQVVRY